MAPRISNNQSQNANPVEPPYTLVGATEGGGSLLFHVGSTSSGEAVFAVSDAPENVDPMKAVRYEQLIAHNPEGWQFFDAIDELIEQ